MSGRDAVREPGFYWVKFSNDGAWQPAQLCQDGTWEVLGWGSPFDTDEFTEIDERRIERQPPEAPAAPAAAAERTVRVRIAVAVTPDGGWSVGGNDDCSDAGAIEEAAWGQNTSEYRVSFVEADVPLPLAPATVAGEVVEG